MIIVTVLRDKLIHSETIRDNQTIKSVMTFDGQDSGSIQFHLSQQQEVDNQYIIYQSENQ